jgi:hypothetical protein
METTSEPILIKVSKISPKGDKVKLKPGPKPKYDTTDKLELSRAYNAAFKAKHYEDITEKHICDVCYGCYTKYNKNQHLRSNRHIKMIGLSIKSIDT